MNANEVYIGLRIIPASQTIKFLAVNSKPRKCRRAAEKRGQSKEILVIQIMDEPAKVHKEFDDYLALLNIPVDLRVGIYKTFLDGAKKLLLENNN